MAAGQAALPVAAPGAAHGAETDPPAHRSSDGSLLYPSLAKSIVGGLIAIAVIVAGLVAINVMTQDDKQAALKSPAASASSGSKSAGAASTSGARSSAAAKAKPKAGAAASSKAAPKAPAKPKPGASKPAAAPASPSPAAAPSPAEAAALRIPLTVLNHSRIRGLAESAKADFRKAGWPVPGKAGNTRYNVTITTVFYSPGQEASARQLLRDVPAVRSMKVRPASLGGSGLTVVVTREYAR